MIVFSGEKQDIEIPMLEMSTISGEGVQEVKNEACERLLSFRVDAKMRTKKVNFQPSLRCEFIIDYHYLIYGCNFQ